MGLLGGLRARLLLFLLFGQSHLFLFLLLVLAGDALVELSYAPKEGKEYYTENPRSGRFFLSSVLRRFCSASICSLVQKAGLRRK